MWLRRLHFAMVTDIATAIIHFKYSDRLCIAIESKFSDEFSSLVVRKLFLTVLVDNYLITSFPDLGKSTKTKEEKSSMSFYSVI